jgi:hypothetical protein
MESTRGQKEVEGFSVRTLLATRERLLEDMMNALKHPFPEVCIRTLSVCIPLGGLNVLEVVAPKKLDCESLGLMYRQSTSSNFVDFDLPSLKWDEGVKRWIFDREELVTAIVKIIKTLKLD